MSHYVMLTLAPRSLITAHVSEHEEEKKTKHKYPSYTYRAVIIKGLETLQKFGGSENITGILGNIFNAKIRLITQRDETACFPTITLCMIVD